MYIFYYIYNIHIYALSILQVKRIYSIHMYKFIGMLFDFLLFQGLSNIPTILFFSVLEDAPL